MKTTLDFGLIDYTNTGKKNCLVTIDIKLKDGNFTASGNIWNERKTDIYSGGQNLDTIKEYLPNNTQVQEIVKVWEKWHLNDMKPNCKHQIGKNWNASKELKIYRFDLLPEYKKESDRIKKEAYKILKTGKIFALTKEQIFITDLKHEIKTHRKKLPNNFKDYYEPRIKKYDWQKKHIEIITAGWTTEKKHPEGILSKPCNICNYKYGSALLKKSWK